jgi:hypothetical protein
MINELFELLAATSGRNDKIALLKKYESNELLIHVLSQALDPFINFYMRKIPTFKTKVDLPRMTLSEAVHALEAISRRKITGDAAKVFLVGLLMRLEDGDAKVLRRIVLKDLRCGVSDSTVNKVWPGLIPTYPVMLCSPMEERALSKFTWPAFAQLKADAMRFNAIVKDGSVELRSRKGKELLIHANLREEFLMMANGHNIVFDGELLVVKDGILLSRQEGNGILSKAQKGTITSAESAMIQAVVWDQIPLVDFLTGESKSPYKHRFAALVRNVTRTNSPRVSVIESHYVQNFDEAQALFRKYLAEGQEGIVLKDGEAHWVDRRSKTQLKMKGWNEVDLRITGIQYGTGKYEGLMGALLGATDDGKIVAEVGTGFTDEHRKAIFEENVGKIMTIKYNSRISSKGSDIQSLFLTSFVEIRDDKDETDTLESMIEAEKGSTTEEDE